MRIEIIGNIGSGRSTLSELMNGSKLLAIKEKFENHPFLESFYEDASKFAFETEICFLLQHYYDIKTSEGESLVCDFSFELDMAFANVTLSESERNVFSSLKEEIESKIGKADLYIYTKTSPEFSLDRIKSRGREMEMGITLEYLNSIHNEIKSTISNLGNVLILDMENLDLLNDLNDINNVKSLINRTLEVE